MKKRTRRQKAIIRRNIFLSLCAVVLICAIVLVSFVVSSVVKSANNNKADNSSKQNISSEPEPEPIPDTFATVYSIGDIMVHRPQLNGAKTATGYDFSTFFKETSALYQKADLTIGNLELTFGGKEAGYSGYPTFNTPDELADNIKASGIDMLMTSNNHSYDTGFSGLKRTAQLLREKGLEYTGTKETETDPEYVVKTINDISIGIANFTYETSGSDPERKYLNGIVTSKEAAAYINTFSYQRIDNFYLQAQNIIDSMKNDGAEFITFYMHWGEEYQLTANNWQKSIAQRLCNMGVDIIIGGHPHVVQPVELIHAEGSDHTTVCIYSLGNAVSNQRRELISSARKGHTEDGAMFTYTLKKSNGEVTLQSVDVIPTWVYRYSDGGSKYIIYPITDISTVSTTYPKVASKLTESYNRTKEIVASGLNECQQVLGCDITFQQ